MIAYPLIDQAVLMSERICILHHLEDCWDAGYKMYGTSFQEEAEKIIDYLKDEKFDRVILVRFEEAETGPEHMLTGLDEYVDEVETYGYGWEREQAEEQHPGEEGITWAEGCDHSEVVYLDPWMKDLAGKDVTLTGAFENECIETVSVALEHCGVDVKREDSLIVGTGKEYEFRSEPGVDPDELRDRVGDFSEDQVPVDLKTGIEAKNAILQMMTETAYSDIRGFAAVQEAHHRLFGFSEGWIANLEEKNLLAVDVSIFEEIEALDKDDANLDEPDPIRVQFKHGAFTVDELDYPLLKLYQDIGVDSMPIHVEAINVDPFETVGVSWDTEAKYQKLCAAASRRLTPDASNTVSALNP
jgi:hypothetical protein